MKTVNVVCPKCSATITVPVTIRTLDTTRDGEGLHLNLAADYDEGILREHVCVASA